MTLSRKLLNWTKRYISSTLPKSLTSLNISNILTRALWESQSPRENVSRCFVVRSKPTRPQLLGDDSRVLAWNHEGRKLDPFHALSFPSSGFFTGRPGYFLPDSKLVGHNRSVPPLHARRSQRNRRETLNVIITVVTTRQKDRNLNWVSRLSGCNNSIARYLNGNAKEGRANDGRRREEEKKGEREREREESERRTRLSRENEGLKGREKEGEREDGS